ncbi:MAG: cysteine synthase A [Chlamydiae bacterium]|nr:MAG: cysteine synthase A [Chlamydiota bacterium]
MKMNILDSIGKTPLIKLNKLSKNIPADILVKLESRNPLGSVKDRIALAMVETAENQGEIAPGATIIEPTSGNTGIGLAFVSAVKGYKLILTMPETMSVERRKLLEIMGAELVLTPGDKGMKGAIDEAAKLSAEIPNSFMPQQFNNPANPEAHYKTTGPEIWNDTNGEIDFFVTGVGTGGTITGTGNFLKEQNSNIKIVAVEPKGSAVISGENAGPHKIQGIGAGFVPEVLNKKIIDDIIIVDSNDAGEISRQLAKKEGILCGISSGANVWAALQLAKKEENKGKQIVTIICDTGERYLSTWLSS